jgi:SHS2 domain-containing protein
MGAMSSDGYRWVEHTAELELEIEAHDEEAVFAEALRAFAELVGDGRPGEPVSRQVALAGQDRAVLLAQWLDELEFLAETEELVPDGLQEIAFSPHGIRATIRCHRDQPRSIVKGVTYHRLTFERVSDGYRATVILDV